MFDKKIRLFLKNYQIVSFNEEQLIPVLEDFLEKCYNAKRKRLKPSKEKISELNLIDKNLIQEIEKSYNLSISFGTNELTEGLENKDAIIEIISEFANFCINPSKYDNPQRKNLKFVTLSNFECHA